MSHGFTPGTKVRVEFEGTVTRPVYLNDGALSKEFWVEVKDSRNVHHLIWAGSAREVRVIQRSEPESWPPAAGDIWETERGKRYFVHLQGGGTVFVEESTGYGIHPADLRASSPKLVYRRGEE